MSEDTIGIKVAVRCRPFVNDDKLGVKLVQVDDDNGEVELLNSDYTTTRFPFSYAWWSAYGYQVSYVIYQQYVLNMCVF
jgi:hypothetical protein